MPYTLTFHTVRDCKPEHDQEIFYVRIDRFYGTSEIRYAKVFYSWQGVSDETSGSSIRYSPEDEANPPEGFVKTICVEDGSSATALLDSCLWVSAADYDEMIRDADKDEAYLNND